MSENSQSGGLKRKRPDDEDEDEDPPAAPPNRRPPYDVRQQVLDLTYGKLERLRHYPDSRLSRYVLILNTVRNLEQDMLKDGIKVGALNAATPSTSQVPFDPSRPPPPDDARVSLETAISSITYSSSLYAMEMDSRTASTSVINSSDSPSGVFPGATGGASYSSEYDRYLMDLDSSSSGRATPFVRSDVEAGALWNEDSDRLTSLNWSSVLKMVDGGSSSAASSQFSSETALELPSATTCSFDASSSCSSSGCSSDGSISDDAMGCSETSLHTLMPVTTGIPTCISSVSVSSTTCSLSSSSKITSMAGSSSSESGSSLPNSEDEIFGDIDLALYDYDFTPLSPPNVKMAPVSAEELMRSLSNDQKADNLVPTSSYFKKDFGSDDREQLTAVRT